MSLNISAEESSAPVAAPLPASSRAAGTEPDLALRRRQLLEELVVELTSWSPRELLVSFRQLHRGTLSLIHLNVLTLLEADGPMPMGRLAEALDVSVASLTGIVTRMESRCLVERAHADHDRRIVIVRRTDAGADVFRGIDEHRRERLQQLATYLTDEQMAGLLAGHRALREARATLLRETADAAAATTASEGTPAADTQEPAR